MNEEQIQASAPTTEPAGNPIDQQMIRDANLNDVINTLKNMVHHMQAIIAVLNPSITVLHNLNVKIQQDEMENKLEL